MPALFETRASSSRRIETGSEFCINAIPAEFSEHDCFYANPIYGLNVGFQQIKIFENFDLKIRLTGKPVRHPIVTAVILEKDRLKRAVERGLGPSASADNLNAVVRDAYELIRQYFLATAVTYYELNEQTLDFHIYEADAASFRPAKRNMPLHVEPGPDAVAKLQAALVF